MTLAIMQPYLFPYIGYFQLIHAADKFVFYDDVNFIKQGWINRNRILQQGNPVYFTLPVKNISSFNKICDTETDNRSYGLWRNKFLKTLQYNYSKAPFYQDTFALVESCLAPEAVPVSDFAKKSIRATAGYLGISTEIVDTSAVYGNANLSAQQRVIDICKKENASMYINVSGGTELYDASDFSAAGIELDFIKSKPVVYKQFDNAFCPGLSIIDIMMFCSKEETKNFLKEYILFKNNS